jgi:hypothetical protein
MAFSWDKAFGNEKVIAAINEFLGTAQSGLNASYGSAFVSSFALVGALSYVKGLTTMKAELPTK